MNVKTENALFTIEIDEKTINDFITSHMPDASLTIDESGKIVLKGKYGILPFTLVVNEIKHGEKHICLILDSIIKSTILATVVHGLHLAEHVTINSLRKEVIINVDALKNPLVKKGIELDPMIERCFVEGSKIIVRTRVSGSYNFIA